VDSAAANRYDIAVGRITLIVEDEVLAAARRQAAARDSSVGELVREFLANLASESEHHPARARLTQLSAASKGRLGEILWTRDDLHNR
jgi:hypothetical protein